jgi:hypothetical protein
MEASHGISAESAPDRKTIYDVGVLVVHGIGQQRKGETVNSYAGAMYEWVRDRLRSSAEGHRHRKSTRETLNKLTRLTPEIVTAAAHDATPMDRATARRYAAYLEALPHFMPAATVGEDANRQLPAPPDEPLMGLVTLSHHRTDTESDPSAALLELDWTDPTGNDHSVQWLIAESWWAESFAAPKFMEIIKAAPLAIPLAFLSHGWAVAQTYRRRGKLHDLLAESYFLVRLWFWFFASIFATPLVYILLWAAQILSWIPLNTFQSSARAVRASLMGVVGDAVALVTDPAIRAALLNRVERDLEWLARRCKSVLLVGHSQGAMLAYLASRTRPNNVKRLLTLGSGIRALQTFIDGIETRFPPIPSCFAIAQVAAVGVFAVAAAGLLHLMPLGAALALGALCFMLAISIGILGIALLFPIAAGRNVVEGFWRARMAAEEFAWVDVIASHDPVPGLVESKFVVAPVGGIQIEPYAPFGFSMMPITKVITNRRSSLADHTSYLANREECVSSLVRHASELGPEGIPWLAPPHLFIGWSPGEGLEEAGPISFARGHIVRRTSALRRSIVFVTIAVLVVLRLDLVQVVVQSLLKFSSISEATHTVWSALQTTDIALAIVAASAVLAGRSAARYAIQRLTTAVLEQRNYRAELLMDRSYRLREQSFRQYAAVSVGEWSGFVISGLLPVLVLLVLWPYLKAWTLVVAMFITVLIVHFIAFGLRLICTGSESRRAFGATKTKEAEKPGG